jgi:hypothetical protein
MSTVSLKKPFASKEKTLSFGILINARQPVITPDASPLLIKLLSGALQTHWYTLPSFHFLSPSSPRKHPQSHGGQGENTMRGEQPPIKEVNHPKVIFSSHPFLLILIAIF